MIRNILCFFGFHEWWGLSLYGKEYTCANCDKIKGQKQ